MGQFSGTHTSQLIHLSLKKSDFSIFQSQNPQIHIKEFKINVSRPKKSNVSQGLFRNKKFTINA